jgi:hypothetical protein|tara:strand:+ start:250 stop:435 length:186 start_codon:yes stop_codon:yes gene_type:complete
MAFRELFANNTQTIESQDSRTQCSSISDFEPAIARLMRDGSASSNGYRAKSSKNAAHHEFG